MHKTRVLLPVLVASFGLAHCTSPQASDWPTLGSETGVVDIDPRLIQAAGSAENPSYTDPFSSPELPWQFFDTVDFADVENGTLRPGVMSHHYPHVTVAGHYLATGTYIFHVAEEDLFYMWGDDLAGHFDGMVGPFRGDPRVVLSQAGLSVP
ncbi:MAG: hypothetical protein OEM81_05325 [Acidimicrobiia bacterium]|nr:hypothetical protein [Acidimicrobiia bacterium]MDH3397239.1 hypothetical protein [Acidimicrobiia bacterium]MDH5616305.1 hypothetical protein [Acidimicrobiia bacterium]